LFRAAQIPRRRGSTPWGPDWANFRQLCGSLLLSVFF
jgi:hypothetical protein